MDRTMKIMVHPDATKDSSRLVSCVVTAMIEPIAPKQHFWTKSFTSLQTVKLEQWRFR
jgi:hypothetical protein